MPPKESEVDEKKLRALLRLWYNSLKDKNVQLPDLRTYISKKLTVDDLKQKLKELKDLKYNYRSNEIKRRIEILYKEFKNLGKPLPEDLSYYTSNKSFFELSEIETKLEMELAEIDMDRINTKLMQEIGNLMTQLSKLGDTEPNDNVKKYIGTKEDPFSNVMLRHSKDILEKRLEDLHKNNKALLIHQNQSQSQVLLIHQNQKLKRAKEKKKLKFLI